MLDAALAYAREGLAVFRCASHTKIPIGGHGVYDATTDKDTIVKWWGDTPNANVAIACGAISGKLLVLDVDPRHWGDIELARLEAVYGTLPPTRQVKTGRGGIHLYFHLPDEWNGKLKKQLAPGIDLQGDGRYVMAPPSTHPDGPIYTGERDHIADCPGWVLDIATKPAYEPPPAEQKIPLAAAHSAYALRAFELEVRRVRDAVEGTLNNTLNEAAFNLGQLVAAGALDRSIVARELLAAAVAAGHPERGAMATIASGLTAGEKLPRVLPQLVGPEETPPPADDPDAPDAEKELERVKVGIFPLIAIRDIPEIITQNWLVRGILPRFDEGAAGYIFGPPKARKSLVLSDLALSVTTGTPALGCYEVEHIGAAVGFFAEDPKGETSRRIHRMARARGIAVPENLWLLDVPALSLHNHQHQALLTATLRSLPDLVFVWLDPMVRLHSINDNRAEELGPIHTFLRVLSRSCPGAVICLAHHMNKSGDSRGSTDYGAFGDFNLYASTPDEVTTHVARIENRGGPPGRPFKFTVEDGMTDAGPTLKLVASELDTYTDASLRNNAALSMVRAYMTSNPTASGREALDHIRKAGIKVGNMEFWTLWKSKDGY